MEISKLKVMRNFAMGIGLLLLIASLVMSILYFAANQDFGSLPIYLVLAALPFVFIVAGIRMKIKKRR